MKNLSLKFAVAALLTASARTLNVANNCAGQPPACVTNLQTALDNTCYSNIEMVGSSTFAGNILIDRTLTLDGNGTATVQRLSGKNWALRAESATNVVMKDFDVVGRVGFDSCTNPTVDGLDIEGNAVGLMFVDCTSVDVLWTVADGDRVLSLQDNDSVNVEDCDFAGADFAIVQDGTHSGYPAIRLSGYPDLDANSSTLTNGTAFEHVAAWTSATRSYNSCGTVHEDVSSSSTLWTPIGYQDWPVG
ncbi:MAG: nitrous oxidase accessory protein NosD [Myxococcota bacterium]|jgi:nitrous oxidase accessory protein NosD